MKRSLADRVRSYAAKREYFLTEDVHAAMDAKTAKEKDAVRVALKDLVKNRTIRRRGITQYEYIGDGRKGREALLKDKMLQAMGILRRFTKHDIVVTTDATFDYVNKTVNRLHAAGKLERVGTKKMGQTKVGVYQLVNKKDEKNVQPV